ncbi:hypothetical protein ACJU26_01760 [Acidithiobacillus sp. M4-SHS-6]|uniref:hypothetical protein n=1 Tax=Acidithiobacillus sp. M4-SHS-6 TaxID=3383024 RepID=UPI0039BDBAF7
MSRTDKWVAGILTLGVVGLLLGVLAFAAVSRIPVAHIYVNGAGARKIIVAGHRVVAAPDWPGAYRVSPRYTDPAFWSTATLYFRQGQAVTIPRQDIKLWVYRG